MTRRLLPLLACLVGFVGCARERDLEISGGITPWRAVDGSDTLRGLGPDSKRIHGECVIVIRPSNILVRHQTDVVPFSARIVERHGWPRPDRNGPWVEVPGDSTGRLASVEVCQ